MVEAGGVKQMRLARSPDWHLRAEEFRTIADAMADARARQTMNRLARGCELLGNGAWSRERASRPDYLARAAACRSFARSLRSPQARNALEQIAEQWVALADKAV